MTNNHHTLSGLIQSDAIEIEIFIFPEGRSRNAADSRNGTYGSHRTLMETHGVTVCAHHRLRCYERHHL